MCAHCGRSTAPQPPNSVSQQQPITPEDHPAAPEQPTKLITVASQLVPVPDMELTDDNLTEVVNHRIIAFIKYNDLIPDIIALMQPDVTAEVEAELNEIKVAKVKMEAEIAKQSADKYAAETIAAEAARKAATNHQGRRPTNSSATRQTKYQ